MNLIKNSKLLIVLLCGLLVSLSGCSDKPFHKVYGTDSLKVYAVNIVDNNKYGKYEYWITDGTGEGWVLRTDKEYKIGDYLEINVKAN